ncbi:hypothetical protein H4Q26_013396 [Puccinia striiformis f. sp. tritici PST-130]|uniref:DNA polymerase epsilon subunit B n=1 Tax=Puccinia striiformis f. sp. tritici PST-78 TaxID=1165861 RepID=A0A0L0UYE0_9BASI|nr:hypothetical protein H4Q26_013396 [Puccinia striiformis f. sp. tritici PST-130]KNE92062.1 hypothetical protein PSTG_14538 [Puccinia striiformis f. sp. tritici PST-78]
MSQEIVISKQNLASKICRNVIEDLEDPTIAADEENIDITKFLVQTILDQAHLSPFPITASPVIWERDQALRLYPMPTCQGSYDPRWSRTDSVHFFGHRKVGWKG